jgi:HTH-type transcriptional regulator/antitoxin HigA
VTNLILGILIDRYENENFPIDLPDPIEAIKFRMEQMGYNQNDLC